MALTFGNVRAEDGTTIFFAMGPGKGVPLVCADPLFYLHASQQVRLDGDLGHMLAMAAGHPWFLFDWRGKGMSGSGDISFRALESDLEAVMNTAGPVCDLYAWGEAVLVAAAVAAKRPQKIRRILFASCERYQSKSIFANGIYQMLRSTPVPGMSAFIRGQHESMDAGKAHALAMEWATRMPEKNFERYREAILQVDDLALVAAGISSPVMIVAQHAGIDRANEAAIVLPTAQISMIPNLRSGTALGEAFRDAWEAYHPANEPQDAELPDNRNTFTPREKEVLRLLLRGSSNASIAADMVISESTAKRHVANIFEKLGVHTRGEAIVAARSLDLDSGPGEPSRKS